MEFLLVNSVAVVSMAGLFVVGVVPATFCAGMAALLVLGMVDGQYGGRLDGDEAGDKSAAPGQRGRHAA